MKITKRMICLVTAFAMVLSAMVSFDSQAKKKKPKLNKTKLTLAVGKTAKLKVKNTKKKVKWSSSKKKIASVSKKGKVKGKKAGKTTITAKVGSKKLKCKVTVKAKKNPTATPISNRNATVTATPASTATSTPQIQATATPQVQATATPQGTVQPTVTPAIQEEKGNRIESLRIEALGVAEVKLAQKQELTLTDFSLMTKAYESGSYSEVLSDVQGVVTTDNITYRVLFTDDCMYWGCRLKVTVFNLEGTGTDSMEVNVNLPCSNTVYLRYHAPAGQQFSGSYDWYDSYDAAGRLKVKSAKLPKGMSYSVDYQRIKFNGTPSEAGTCIGDVVCEDELGHTYTLNIGWMMDNEDTISAWAMPMTRTYTGKDVKVSYKFYVEGGSGSYTYEVPQDVSGADISVVSGKIEATFSKPGTYNIPIKVTDAEDDSIYTTLDWKAVITDTKKVTVNPLLADDSKLNDEELHVFFLPGGAASADEYISLNEVGGGSTYLPKGTYQVFYYYGELKSAAMYQKTITVEDENITLDLVFPVYKVNITCEKESAVWHDENGAYVGSGNTVYLPEGKHTLRYVYSTGPDYGTVYEAAVETGSGKPNAVTITGKEGTGLSEKLTAGTPISVKLSYKGRAVFTFTPTESGSYTFYRENIRGYSRAVLADIGNFYDDTCSDTYSVKKTYDLKAGETYYYMVEGVNDSPVALDLCVKKDS